MWPIIFLILSFTFLCLVIGLLTTKKGKGIAGELVVSHLLDKLDKSKYFTINNITLKINGMTSQIDHIVVSCYGIFVIETKNWKGSVYGSRWSKELYQYLGGVKFKHQNPIRQNIGHIKCLKEVLSSYPNLEYISIVAFGGYSKRKIKDDISINISEILNTIRKYKEEVISEIDRDSVYTKLERLKVEGDSYREEHIENINKKYGSKMTKEEYIDRFGILLEDVLISREKALKRNRVSFTKGYTCFRCGNTDLEEFYASNSDECWRGLCGVGGECIFCNKCMDIVEFYKTEMS